MGGALWAASSGLSSLIPDGWVWRIVGLVLLIAGGALVYGVLVLAAGAIRLEDLRAWMRRGPAE